MTGAGGRRAGLLLVVLLAILVHARALGGDFVFDDHRFITDNARIDGVGDPLRFFADPSTADPGRPVDIYRPLRTLVFAVEKALFGLDPGPWHAVPLLVHAANAALVYLLMIHFGLGTAGALAGAAVFAVHPAQVEAVAWISSLADVLAALFTLIGIRCWLRSRGPDRWYALAVGAGVLACFTKEAALVYPGFLVLADLARPDGGGPAAVWRRRLGYLLPALLAAGFGLAVRALLTGVRGGQLGHLGSWWGGSYGTNLATAAMAAAYQGVFAALPLIPATEWYLLPARSVLEPFALLCGAGVAGALAAAARGVLRGGRDAVLAGTGVLFFALAGLMTSSLLFTVGIPRTDRFLYLSLAGAAMVHGVLLERLARPWPRLAPALAAAGVLGMAAISFARIDAFRDDETFWREAAAGRSGPRPECHLLTLRNREGTALLERAAGESARGEDAVAVRDFAGARAIFEEVVAATASFNARWKDLIGFPMDGGLENLAKRNLALAKLRSGDPAGALRSLEEAARTDPANSRGLFLEALALRAEGRMQRAGWRIEAYLAKPDPSLSPTEAAAVLNAVAAWRASRGLDGATLRALHHSASLVPDGRRNPVVGELPALEARVAARRRELAAAAAARPGDLAAQLVRVLYEGRGGSPREAREAYQGPFGAGPETGPTRDLWAAATMEADDTEAGWRAAEKWHRETLLRFPGDAGALLGLARCRESLEDRAEAARRYREVRDIPGVSPDALREAEEGLARTGP